MLLSALQGPGHLIREQVVPNVHSAEVMKPCLQPALEGC
jgi:hypothetical protein